MFSDLRCEEALFQCCTSKNMGRKNNYRFKSFVVRKELTDFTITFEFSQ